MSSTWMNFRTAWGFALAVCGAVSFVAAEDNGPTTIPVPKIAVLPAANHWVTSLAFSAEGKLLAVGSRETVKVYSVADQKLETLLDDLKGQVRALAFSTDGSQLAVGCYQSLQLWDMTSEQPKLVRESKAHRGYVTGIAYSPDGQRIVSSSDDETAQIQSASDAGMPVALNGHKYSVNAAAWSRDGQRVATAAGDDTRITKPGEVKVWDAATGQELFSLGDHKRATMTVAFSPDANILASGGLDEKVILTDLETQQAIGSFNGHQRPVNCVLFHPNGQTVISGSGGRFVGGHTVKLWNRESGEELASLENHEGRISALAVSQDGMLMASGSYDKQVILWSLVALGPKVDVGAAAVAQAETKVIRVGVIGLDTSHAPAFADAMNKENPEDDIAGVRIVAAYPKGSPDIESSVSRVPQYTEDYKKRGIEIVDSIPALLEKVDAVLLETNDGRPHYEQALPVLQAGKPCFIDKPIAGTLTDAVAIFEAAKKYKTPVFSSSSLRYMDMAQKVRAGSIGDVLGCDTFSPASLEPTHPDLFWYGIHGVEALFTVMGTGCETVQRASTPGFDVVMGTWTKGRIGTFRGIRAGGGGYGGRAFGSKGVVDLGTYGGYRPLAVDIVKFFKTKQPPVDEEETLEIYAFMEAADESKRQGGCPVKLADVLKKARKDAAKKIALLK